MTVDNHLTMQKSNELLQQLSERLTQLEKRISLLEHPQLMYRPPKSEKHITIAQTLDSLHKDVDSLIDKVHDGRTDS